MKTTGLNLLIPDKPDVERDAVARAFESCGGAVHRVARFWDPPHFDPPTVRVYGADAFCLVLEQKIGFTLCSPSDELLLSVPARFLNRQIARRTLGETPSADFPNNSWRRKLATPVGLEPTTSRLEVWHSIQLSYGVSKITLAQTPPRKSRPTLRSRSTTARCSLPACHGRTWAGRDLVWYLVLPWKWRELFAPDPRYSTESHLFRALLAEQVSS